MDSDVKLQEGTVEIIGDRVKADVGFGGGTVELNGSNLKTTVSNIEMYYYGGHLTAKDGNMELGSSDSGKFIGFSQAKDSTVQITGSRIKTDAASAEIGSRSSGNFKGLSLSESGISCYTYALTVRNPNVEQPDGQQRIAMAQNERDELLINGNGHYTGGVKVDGAVRISDVLTVQKSLKMSPGSKLLLMTPDMTTKLPNGKIIRLPGIEIDVLETITQLQNTIRQLENRVAALETK